MRKIIAGGAIVLALSACTTAQQQTATNVVNTGCTAFETVSWAVPILQQQYAGKLNATQQSLLTKAESLVSMGCAPSDATAIDRAELIAEGLVAILYPAAPVAAKA